MGAEGFDGAADLEDGGRGGDGSESLGVVWGEDGEEVRARGVECGEFVVDLGDGVRAGLDDFGCGVLADAWDAPELVGGGAEDGPGVAEGFEEARDADGPEARDEGEREEGAVGVGGGRYGHWRVGG